MTKMVAEVTHMVIVTDTVMDRKAINVTPLLAARPRSLTHHVAVLPTRTAADNHSSPTFNVPRANALAILGSTVTCWPRPFA
jgi:hypothetical protein